MKFTRNELLALLEIEKEMREWEDTESDSRSIINNGFDYKPVDIIVPEPGCKWNLAEMEWGFIPDYWWTRKDVVKNRTGYFNEQTGKRIPPMITLNAKGEELLFSNKMYREAALNRRCLFPATDFFEWRHVFPLGKNGVPLKTAVKYPYHIGVKEEEVFFIAGIWQSWTDRETGKTVDTCAMCTTEANSLMKQVHNSKGRMPTMLTTELAPEWISSDLTEKRITEIATFQIPTNKMEAYTIRKDFLSAPDPTEAFVYNGLSELVA